MKKSVSDPLSSHGADAALPKDSCSKPSYLSGVDLARVSASLEKLLSPCMVCPFECGTDRRTLKSGRCRSGLLPKIASWNLHHGEEPPISGHRGSGTLFFSWCSLRCFFCQNYPISQLGNGKEVSSTELAEYMLLLQKRGAHNINFVTPTHFIPQAVEALRIAVSGGLRIPIVYNSSGYERVETLKLLDGIVDIYLPDMKYGNNECARKYSGVGNYVEVNCAAIKEMYRQVGTLQVDEDGIAKRGLIIRHLVLPGNLENTEEVLRSIAILVPDVPLSLMGQFFPAHIAHSIPELSRKLNRREYEKAVNLLEQLGIMTGWVQSL